MSQMECMTEKVKEYRLLNAQAARLTHAKGELGKSIRAEMQANGVERISAGDYTVRTVRLSRRHFDVAAFREAHPDLAERYTVSTDVCRFTIE